jgi:hypothetical protein
MSLLPKPCESDASTQSDLPKKSEDPMSPDTRKSKRDALQAYLTTKQDDVVTKQPELVNMVSPEVSTKKKNLGVSSLTSPRAKIGAP